MRPMTAGEVVSSVVFGGAAAVFALAAADPARGWPERVVLAICAAGTGIAVFRFQIARWWQGRR